jgi:ketosteroid isomerase-like protein
LILPGELEGRSSFITLAAMGVFSLTLAIFSLTASETTRAVPAGVPSRFRLTAGEAQGLTDEFHNALLKKDVRALTNVLADDFTFTDPLTGNRAGKADFLQVTADPALQTRQIRGGHDIKVVLDGQEVILKNQRMIFVGKREELEGPLTADPRMKVTHVYRRGASGRLQLVSLRRDN